MQAIYPGGRTHVADYELIKSLGEGNHGRFYLARPPRRIDLGVEFVAVKVFNGACSEDAFRRCVRELRAFASAESPYLATIYDAALDNEFLYAMEYFPLGSLAMPARPLSHDHVLRAVEHAAHAVHALHEAGLAHRDVKPSNILLHEGGAKLSDLGLSQMLTPGMTVTAMGPTESVEFMHPTLLYGEPASRATDIWSLGATLHRALAKTSLYGEIPQDPLLAVRTVLRTKPHVAPELTEQEAELVLDCLAEPGRQPATAEVVAERIAAIRATLPSGR